ncbi:copper amine oxidase N-terminal domain-containing protein [Caminicella sporogenes]|uniref:copper amine oxidase N-terminal domain-containing protein n=1 Tax=Caminicella sporogenes TaxID=166485 RepID=UPI0025415495|nr:copper amine oxidase N-terminal domain-containing protein [Caminicella sporogenes]WIF96028.1 copper amine oxidase N-terminal domain-containing protein [Caminicella sporogenes]
MKRFLSLVVALTMVLAPMSAFAATSNSIDKVIKVGDSDEINNVDIKAPYLRIEEDNDDEFGSDKQVFRLTLENAEWLDSIETAATLTNRNVGDGKDKVFLDKIGKKTVEAVVYGDGINNNSLWFKIPMLVEMKGEGEAKVTIDDRDSLVSSGTYTFAIGAGGDTIASIDDVEEFTDTVTIDDIRIDETSVGAIDDNTNVKLKLPSDFKWYSTPSASDIVFTGGLEGCTVSNIDVDGRTLEFDVDVTGKAGKTRGTIYIKNLQVTAEKDADYGDVEVSISGDKISSTDLVVAKYCDYDVTVKADGEPEELISGEWDSSYNDDKFELQTLVIEEKVANAWLGERKTRVEFPSWVKILGVKYETDSEDVGTLKGLPGGDLSEGASREFPDGEKDDNYVEFTAPNKSTTNEGELYLTFYVSVEAGHSGDITAKVTGRSLPDDYEVVLGKAVAPVEVKAEGADVRTGVKGQKIGDITITETVKEAIKEGDLKIVLDDDVDWTDVPKIEVVKGNLDLDVEGAEVDNNVLTIPVDSDSSKPSTIKLSNVEVDLNRVVAEGDIKVKVKGDAVVENYKKETTISNPLDNGFFDEDTAAEAVVATVITPADNDTKARAEVKFQIGSKEYQVGDEIRTADVAPYIKDGRTMLSVRFVAEAMGVPSENIVWNGEARTVTIFKGDRIAQLTIGSNILTVNGTKVVMDTAAEIKDGRTMLPIRFIAQALGADISWDGSTRTVTVK